MNQREMISKTQMENLVREAYEKGLFNGTWLCAEKGKIIGKGALVPIEGGSVKVVYNDDAPTKAEIIC